jgi:hypothetical protein
VLTEIVLPNSNTAEMCEAFVDRRHPYAVLIYGDAAGGTEHDGTLRLRDHPTGLSLSSRTYK